MAGHAPEIAIKKHPHAKVAIISSSWHPELCGDLIAGAKRALEAADVKKIEVIFVPGSFEIPLAAQKAFESSERGACLGMAACSTLCWTARWRS
jgi:6,7-dimethyl-8-ribityllumazine synthase